MRKNGCVHRPKKGRGLPQCFALTHRHSDTGLEGSLRGGSLGGALAKAKYLVRRVWKFCRRLHNLNRRADSLCASLCASPLPRPKAPRCVPLSLRPRAVAFCASLAPLLRVLCASLASRPSFAPSHQRASRRPPPLTMPLTTPPSAYSPVCLCAPPPPSCFAHSSSRSGCLWASW